MAIPGEMELPQPLEGAEIREAIAEKIKQAVLASLAQRGKLYQRSYPKFRASFMVEYTLDDFGRKVEGSVTADLPVQAIDAEMNQYRDSEEKIQEPVTGEVNGEIPETPPNLLRRETGQAVPTMVQTPQGTEQKAVFYQQKRGPRIGRGAR
jgi:hypothetical protein